MTYLMARKNKPFSQINLKFCEKVTKFNLGSILYIIAEIKKNEI